MQFCPFFHSIISAFQASASMKKDAFSKLYESIHHGADGFDCTVYTRD